MASASQQLFHVEHGENAEIAPSVSGETRMCPCGMEPCRPGQRNGLRCHAVANQIYRARRLYERERREKEISALRLALMVARLKAEESEEKGFRP